jgi:hypothetical protein
MIERNFYTPCYGYFTRKQGKIEAIWTNHIKDRMKDEAIWEKM